MKKITNDSAYATNKGGFIKAPKPVKDEARATVTKGDDLRTRGGKR